MTMDFYKVFNTTHEAGMKLQIKKKKILFFQTNVQSSLDPGKTDGLKELIPFLVELNSVFSTQTMAASNLPDGVGFLDHTDFHLITASRISEKNGQERQA